MELQPVKDYVPEELALEPLEYEEAMERKLGMDDSTLQRYYQNDKVQVYEISPDSIEGTVLPELVIEKKPNKVPNEIEFAILADEIGAGPEVLYLRNSDGEISYSMPFLYDFGMFEDLELNSIPDFHDYAEAVGETYAPLYMADIMHEDLIGMKTTGRFSDTPYIRNLMVSGSEDKATLIDFEDAHLGEDPPKKDLGDVSIRELIPADREDEYEALEAALFSEAIRDFSSFWDQIAGHEIVKPEFVDHDHFKNLDFVNIDKFTRIFSSNQDIQEEVREIQNSFERGFDSGCRNNGKKQFYQRTNPSAIDINHSPADDLRTAARKRLDSDIEPFVQETLTELETTPVDEA